jgi:biotin transport system substrate-specific component
MSQVKETLVLGIELQNMPIWTKNLILVLGSSILIGLFAHVSIPLPFTPIPIATQPSLVLFLAVVLGSKRAVGAVFAFLLQGALGLPVFVGGAAGLRILMGPRAGYFFGYLIAAYLVGKLMEIGGKRSILQAFFSMVAGNVIIYFFGAAALSLFIGGSQALLLGVLPFILGDLVKIAIGLKFLRCLGWEEN